MTGPTNDEWRGSGRGVGRVLLVLPSWVGDAVMATPALRLVRRSFPGAFIGALARPGIDQLLSGLTDGEGRVVFDEVHVDRPTGVFGPKRAAARLRPRMYQTALLLTGSFSSAMITRIAGIPRRIGYARDGRGFLLTDRLNAPKTSSGAWAIVPAVRYYWFAAEAMVSPDGPRSLQAPGLTRVDRTDLAIPADERLALAVSSEDRAASDALLAERGIDAGAKYVILNPGGNKPEKRWPIDRYAMVADHLARAHGVISLINGSPAEADLCEAIVAATGPETRAVSLPGSGHTLRTLMGLAASPACVAMITNDTGPRHIAAAVGCPVVSLFGPTDARWTSIPTEPLIDGSDGETVIVADKTLEPAETANDHPERCAIERISFESVISAVDRMIAGGRRGVVPGSM